MVNNKEVVEYNPIKANTAINNMIMIVLGKYRIEIASEFIMVRPIEFWYLAINGKEYKMLKVQSTEAKIVMPFKKIVGFSTTLNR